MSLPQEESFPYTPRQKYRNNVGLIENPIGTQTALPKALFASNSQSKYDSLKRPNHNFNGAHEESQQPLKHRNASAGKHIFTSQSNILKFRMITVLEITIHLISFRFFVQWNGGESTPRSSENYPWLSSVCTELVRYFTTPTAIRNAPSNTKCII